MDTLQKIATAPAGSEIRWFEGPDGTPLRWYRHVPAGAEATVLFLQGRADFIKKNNELYHDLADAGWAVAAPEWRGQGLSGRLPADDRYYDRGHIDDFGTYLADLEAFARLLATEDVPQTLHLVAFSMGAMPGLMWLAAQPAAVTGATLLAPMVSPHTGKHKPWLVRMAGRYMTLSGRAGRFVPGRGHYGDEPAAEVIPRLTSDKDRFYAVHAHIAQNRDLRVGGPTWSWLLAAMDGGDRLTADKRIAGITIPTLFLLAEDDQLVRNEVSRTIAGAIPGARVEVVPGSKHDLLIEADAPRGFVIGRILGHLEATAAPRGT